MRIIRSPLSALRSSLLASQAGQSLIELLVAAAVGTIMIIGALTVIAPSLKSNSQANQTQVSNALGKELLDNVRVLAESNWHAIYDLNHGSGNHYYLVTTSTPFSATSGSETVTVATSTFQRYFYVENVNRDAEGSIVASGGTNDPSTQKVSVVFQGPQGQSRTMSVYFTRYLNNVFWQTDWSSGSGQTGPVSSTVNSFASSTNINFSTTSGSIRIDL
ncbi:MAG: prepilin-type N-terminal cleavage/methylation domain-containing protein [Candidatus Liptonbacteria bacterium]|nr:prepilin-type N-terminal cleavage/methylation domain-containing protein [Candidatus Liptonbacteria bacterium]